MGVRKRNSTYSRNEESISGCDLSYAIQKIGGRWKLQILSLLEDKKYRFSELKKEFPLITERILALQLKALERDGLIRRTVYAEVPPRVEYELTDIMLKLGPTLKQLSDWGNEHRKEFSRLNESLSVSNNL